MISLKPALRLLARISIFIASFVVVFAIAIFMYLGLIPDMIGLDNDSRGKSLPLSATIVVFISTTILFKKIVLKMKVKALIIALIFYVSCNALSILMIIIGKNELSLMFGWIGIIGIVAGFIISKAKKNQDANLFDRN